MATRVRVAAARREPTIRQPPRAACFSTGPSRTGSAMHLTSRSDTQWEKGQRVCVLPPSQIHSPPTSVYIDTQPSSSRKPSLHLGGPGSLCGQASP